jgi:drug/metabolite transporter (DMT)-like permease
MPLTPLVLVLVSAFLHAVWNALIKREKDPRSASLAVLAIAALVATVAVPFAQAPSFPRPAGLRWAAGAGLLEGGYFVTLGLALARGPLGPAYTVARGGAMLVAWPISVLCLGESFTLSAKFGVALIGCGLGLTAIRPHEHATRSSLVWAALCAVCIAGYHLCYKLALTASAEPKALFAVALACALPINLACLGRSGTISAWYALRESPCRLLVGGVTCTASFLVFLEALASVGAGAVLTLRNTSVLFAQLLAMWTGERTTKRTFGGAVLVVAGAALLAR